MNFSLSGRPWQKKYPHTPLPLVEKDTLAPFRVEAREIPWGRRTQWVTLIIAICEPTGEEDPAIWENEIVFLESLLIATDIALGMLQGCLPDLYTRTAEGLHPDLYTRTAEGLVSYRVDVDFLDTTLREVEGVLQWYISNPQDLSQPANIWVIRNAFNPYAEPEPGDDPVENTQVLGVYLNSCVEERTQQQLTRATDIVRRSLELIDHWSLAPPETSDVFYLVRDVCWLMASYMRPDLPWSTVVPRAWRTEEEAKEAAAALQKAFDIWWQEVKNVLPMRDLPEMETLL